MRSRTLRLLLIEDNESDAALLERHLLRADLKLHCRRVDSLGALEQALAAQSWDMVLSDYNLSGFDALDALRTVRKSNEDLPFIVVSGIVGEEAAVELMRSGAQDYVSKDRLSRLIPAMERELKEAAAHRRQRRLSARIAEHDERLKRALSATGDGVWERNLRTRSIVLSEQWKTMLGYAPNELDGDLGAWLELIHPDDRKTVDSDLADHRAARTSSYRSEYRLRCKDGSWKWVLDRGVVIARDAQGAALREIGTSTDISRSKQTEVQLRQSHDVLRKLASQVPGMLYQFQLHPDGRRSLPFVSEAVHELYELTPEQIRVDATAIFALVHPDDLPSLNASIERSAATMTRWKHEHRVVVPSKGIRWMSGESQPERLPDGSILWHGFIHDVTARKNADEELRLLQACVNQLHDTIIITDAEPLGDPGPRIVYVNSAFERQTGYSAAEAIGKTPRILQGPGTDGKTLRRIGAALRRWENTRAEVLNYTKDGGLFWAELDIAPVADDTGWYTNWISVQRDVTERKRADQEREQLIEQLETRHAELNAYNHWVAHDLRNPVIAIHGIADLAELALEAGDSKRALKYIQRIEAVAEQADKLIKSLMAVAKLGRSGLSYTEISVAEVVQSVLNDLSYIAKASHAEFELDLPAELRLISDSALLTVILRNLISNAIKHRHPNRHPVVRISASLTRDPDGITLSVADNGVGIDQHHHSRVFGLFERINDDTEGVGLGLAMVDRAARLLYGRTHLDHSQVDVGSRFSVWLPLDKPATHVQASAQSNDPEEGDVWSIQDHR